MSGPSDECFLFELRNRQTGATSLLKMANLTMQVVAIRFPTASRAIIAGLAAPNLNVLTVIDLPSGKELDTFVGFWATFSPDSRFIAYVKWYPDHIGYGYSLTNEYLVYDLEQSPSRNRTPGNRARAIGAYDAGWPIYPPNSTNQPGDNVLRGPDVPTHTLASKGFFWIGDQTVAFADRWHDANSVVVAQLSNGTRTPTVVTKSLPTSQLVDLENCAPRATSTDLHAWSITPGKLVFVSNIKTIPNRPEWIRLELARQPCLTNTVLDIDTELALRSQ